MEARFLFVLQNNQLHYYQIVNKKHPEVKALLEEQVVQIQPQQIKQAKIQQQKQQVYHHLVMVHQLWQQLKNI